MPRLTIRSAVRSHPIQLELDEDLIGRVDAPRLRRVLDNLLGNAIKYSPDGGEIFLRLSAFERAGERWAGIEVTDHGVGIPANDLPRIFNRYSRGGNVGGIKGTGLGLAGVRQIVLQHGGSTEIESEVGRGTNRHGGAAARPRGLAAPVGRASLPSQPSEAALEFSICRIGCFEGRARRPRA